MNRIENIDTSPARINEIGHLLVRMGWPYTTLGNDAAELLLALAAERDQLLAKLESVNG